MLDFPSSPTDKQLYIPSGVAPFMYDSAKSRWTRAGGWHLMTKTGALSGLPAYTFALPAGYREFKVYIRGVRPASTGDTLYMRVSIDGGATFPAGASSYLTAGIFVSGNNQSRFDSATLGAQTVIFLSPTTMQPNAQGDVNFWELTIEPGAAGVMGTVQHIGEYYELSGGGGCVCAIGSSYHTTSGRWTHFQILDGSNNLTIDDVIVLGIPDLTQPVAAGLTWTKSIDPNTFKNNYGFAAGPYTFSSVPYVGSADCFVEIAIFQKGADSADPTGVTIMGQTGVKRAGGFASDSSAHISFWGAKVTSGTSGSVVITTATAQDFVAIAGGYFTGNASMVEDGTEVTQNGTYSDFTLPAKTFTANGGGLAAMMCYNSADFTPAWGAGMAGDYKYFNSAASIVCLLGHVTTFGSSITPSFTGVSDAKCCGAAVGYL